MRKIWIVITINETYHWSFLKEIFVNGMITINETYHCSFLTQIFVNGTIMINETYYCSFLSQIFVNGMWYWIYPYSIYSNKKQKKQQQSSKHNKTKQKARKNPPHYSIHMRRDKYNVVILADTCMHM